MAADHMRTIGFGLLQQAASVRDEAQRRLWTVSDEIDRLQAEIGRANARRRMAERELAEARGCWR